VYASLWVSFKLIGGTVPEPTGTAKSPYIMIRLNGESVRVLVDSGSPVSLLPRRLASKCRLRPRRCQPLQSINGSPIAVHGTTDTSVQFAGLTRRHPFYVADVTQALVGCDFLSLFELGICFSHAGTPRVVTSAPPVSDSKSSRGTLAAAVQTEASRDPSSQSPEVLAMSTTSGAPVAEISSHRPRSSLSLQRRPSHRRSPRTLHRASP
jgi:hypothetical protein